MSAFLETMAAWLVDYFAAATLLLAAALVLRMVIRQPAARMAVAWCTCLGLVVLALLTAWPTWPRMRVAELPETWPIQVTAATSPQPEADLPPEELPAEVVSPFVAPLATDEVAASPTPAQWPTAAVQTVAWNQLLSAAWTTFAACAIGWMLLGWTRARGLVATAIKAPAWVHDELRRIVGGRMLPHLLASQRVNSAVALGVLSPKIILPQASIVETNAPAVRAALAHEWAHIRHGDLWLLAIERLLVPLLGAHPLFWWLRRSVRLDQELLADAAAAGDEPAEYAAALLAWAKTAQPARHGLAALSMWEHPNTLSRRVNMVLDPKRPLAQRLSNVWTAVMVALAIPLILGASLITLRPTTAQEKPAEVQNVPAIPLSRLAAEPATAGTIPESKSVPVTQVQMDLLILSVDREKLAAADTTLEDAISAATESRCRREPGLVVADIATAEVTKLMDQLKKHNAVKVLSRPSVITIDGREAVVHVGGEAPILRVEETINGQHEQRVEFKEFGTIIMVRPKVTPAGDEPEKIVLELVAEQASLLPPGEKADPAAVPRDVPGLVSHKFKLTADAKIGGSLLVAESPAQKNQLRAGVKEQFVVVVSPKKVIRTVTVAYADPREGEKGEAARAATEAALDAATAAEPEPGTAAAALLKAERETRAKETAELRKQIEALQRDLQKLRAATETKLITREYVLKHRKARDVAADLSELAANSANQDRFQLTVDAGHNSITIQVVEKFAGEFEKVIAALDRPATPLDPNDPTDAHAQQIQRILAERRKARATAGAQEPQPPATDPAAQVYGQQANWGLIMADLAEARLELERAEKEFARIEQLKANKAVSQVEVDQKQYELERAKIQVQRAMAKLYAPSPAAVSPATSDRVGLSQGTEARLLELDLAEAKLAVEEAEARLANVEEIKQKNPGALSDQELRTYRLGVERAKIQMQRVMIKIEAIKEPPRAAK